jgi:16S rRNA (guanine527-N7)-methyltransferase
VPSSSDARGKELRSTVGEPPALVEELFGERTGSIAQYAHLLCAEGVAWGLIGPAEPDRIWDRHILNCAAVAALVPAGADVIDIGSGAGLPGLVWALLRPDLAITCVEPSARRCRFLELAVKSLCLERVRVVQARGEQLNRDAAVVTARAVAPWPKLAAIAAPLVRRPGVLLAIRGANAADEVAGADNRSFGLDWATVETCELAGRPYATVVRAGRAARPKRGASAGRR